MREFGLSPLLLRPLARVLARLDVDGNRFLVDLGIDERTPDDVYLDPLRADHLLAEIAAQRNDPCFGLTLAKSAVIHPLGFFDHLVWPGATVRDAIYRSARFYPLLTRRSSLELDEQDGIARLTQHLATGATRGVAFTELAFASLVLRARGAANGLELRAMSFVHDEPPGAREAYDTLFGVEVTFGAPLDVLELDVAQLERPLGTADPVTAAALEDRALKMHGAAIAAAPFLNEVRAAIRTHLGESEDLAARVAESLGYSKRKLQRRLEQHGTALAALVDEVRRELALTLLERGAPLGEVASELGFVRTQAFHKAFVRWTGVAPGSFRGR